MLYTYIVAITTNYHRGGSMIIYLKAEHTQMAGRLMACYGQGEGDGRAFLVHPDDYLRLKGSQKALAKIATDYEMQSDHYHQTAAASIRRALES